MKGRHWMPMHGDYILFTIDKYCVAIETTDKSKEGASIIDVE